MPSGTQKMINITLDIFHNSKSVRSKSKLSTTSSSFGSLLCLHAQTCCGHFMCITRVCKQQPQPKKKRIQYPTNSTKSTSTSPLAQMIVCAISHCHSSPHRVCGCVRSGACVYSCDCSIVQLCQ